MRNRWVYPSSRIQWKTKKNGLPVFFYFLPPLFTLSLLIWSPLSIFKILKSMHLLSVFCLHTPCLGMTTKTKIVQLRARQTCFVWVVFVHCTQNVRLTIRFCFFVLFFFTTKAGFAIIFEIKCNFFF